MTTEDAVYPVGPKPSTFQNMMDWMQAQGPMLLSFEDLSGMSYDYPQLVLPERLRRHVSNFCTMAKDQLSSKRGKQQCPLNKLVANRATQRQGDKPLIGGCYLGVTDICRSLIYQGQVIGVFYYGSVICQGELEHARSCVKAICQHDQIDPRPLLRRLNALPVVSEKQVQEALTRLEQLIEMVQLLLQGLGVPVELYETHSTNRVAFMRTLKAHPMVLRTLRIIREEHAQPLTLIHVAQKLRCHPVYLSRLFCKQVGKPFSEYLRQIRIERACRLLALKQLDITAVGMAVGYEDKSNFGRAFRKVKAMSPGQYQSSL